MPGGMVNRHAALFPKQELYYPAIAPQKLPREPEKSLQLLPAQSESEDSKLLSWLYSIHAGFSEH